MKSNLNTTSTFIIIVIAIVAATTASYHASSTNRYAIRVGTKEADTHNKKNQCVY